MGKGLVWVRVWFVVRFGVDDCIGGDVARVSCAVVILPGSI